MKWLPVLLLLILCLPMLAGAEEARDISGTELVTESTGFSRLGSLFDGNDTSGYRSGENASLTVTSPEGFGSAYLIFDVEYGSFTVADADTGESQTVGEENFLHTFLDLEALFGYAPTTLRFSFDNGPTALLELRLFTPGQVPDWVQRWEAPAEGETDLLLFSTHMDDEQLFFAGMLPYYAGELGYRVQVAYLTNHRNLSPNPNLRCHEALNGLWAVGVRNYPVIGSFADYYSRNEKDAIGQYQWQGVGQEELLGYVVEQLRRFRPLVAVGHDLNGEYGHGAHMLYADLLTQAAEISEDASAYPESAEAYGVWQVPKVYLHLYEEKQLVMDWDRPLDRFDGMTAYQVSKELGFPCHASQVADFAWYMSGAETAAQIEQYSPCLYGLYSTHVGPDTEKQDLFEHLTGYAQQALERQQAAEEQARQEELARLEAQRRETEQRAQAESLAAESASVITPEAEPAAVPTWLPALFAAVILLTGLTLWLCRRRK